VLAREAAVLPTSPGQAAAAAGRALLWVAERMVDASCAVRKREQDAAAPPLPCILEQTPGLSRLT